MLVIKSTNSINRKKQFCLPIYNTNFINYYNINDYNKLNIKFNLIIMTLRSFNKNVDTFIICIDNLIVKPDILIFTEIWLSDKESINLSKNV